MGLLFVALLFWLLCGAWVGGVVVVAGWCFVICRCGLALFVLVRCVSGLLLFCCCSGFLWLLLGSVGLFCWVLACGWLGFGGLV